MTTTKDLTIEIPQAKRHIKARLGHSDNPYSSPEQLIIIAAGLHSHMDKESQKKVAQSYQQAGFATLQFNFAGHGQDQNKSDGSVKDVTLSSGIQDLKTIWDYAKTQLPKNINTNHTVISANSYGALISLLALERNLISPESMVLVAPFLMDKFKKLTIPLWLLNKFMPAQITQILKLPVSSNMVVDFLENHTHDMEKKDLLGSTAVHFFVGSDDKISSPKGIQKWCQKFNRNQNPNVNFVDNIQAHYKEYPGVQHFSIPEEIHQDIMTRAVKFIHQTHAVRLKENQR